MNQYNLGHLGERVHYVKGTFKTLWKPYPSKSNLVFCFDTDTIHHYVYTRFDKIFF